jgi:exopolysaccharide biosynthesis protein
MRRSLVLVLFLGTFVSCAHGGWQEVAEGVDYRRINRDGVDMHVARIDLRAADLRVVATAEEHRGTTVSEMARATGALVAVNADYFDDNLRPIGLAMGGCEVWGEPRDDVRRQPIVAVAPRRVAILARDEFPEEGKRWMTGAVSGWPRLVEGCAPIESLPGSDSFTRAPHPRTAVGLSRDGMMLYLVVADGRRPGVTGPTLPELAQLMTELGVCSALNLDGGGSSAMWIGGKIVNQPSDGPERRVTNHLAVVPAARAMDCASQ